MSRERSTYDVDPGKGWIMFAGTMLALVGCLNMIYGIAAISNSTFFLDEIKYVFGNLNTWGWIMTVVGAAQIAISFGIFTETEWGRWGGIIAACVNMIVQFLAINGHPILGVMIFFIDIIIVWGLMMYGGRDRHSMAG